MISTSYRILAWSSFVGMFFVLVAGAIVTQTGSGRGCGSDWPLCNGRFIPAYTLESLIEYSHRLITGIVGLLVVCTFFSTWPYRKPYREAFVYASGTLIFTIIQALMGAAAVKWTQQPAVMALHFGISLLAVAASMLLVVWIHRFNKPSNPSVQSSTGISLFAWFIWLFCYGVVYLGAFIRHMKVEGGCSGWPLCNGRVIPVLTHATEVVFAHRLAAIFLLVLMIAWLIIIRRIEAPRERAAFTMAAVFSLLCTVGQILSGAWLTYAFRNVNEMFFASLLHNTLATLLFSLLTDTAIRSWKYRKK
ncbi:COX15/CtaA family protein [Paenibacillus dokdonensis]|uniref:COX15/CtaA family protein n=1 Tax=Paenibacillus dokdonensis TaxID=2567944 RepID=UPI0010A881BD|nr:COX15/CtaA family protein [Paenibacillus dokdonensis]